jgi:hypothetical protein
MKRVSRSVGGGRISHQAQRAAEPYGGSWRLLFLVTNLLGLWHQAANWPAFLDVPVDGPCTNTGCLRLGTTGGDTCCCKLMNTLHHKCSYISVTSLSYFSDSCFKQQYDACVAPLWRKWPSSRDKRFELRCGHSTVRPGYARDSALIHGFKGAIYVDIRDTRSRTFIRCA